MAAPTLDTTFGATLVGLTIEGTVYGVTLLQTFFYFRNYADDRWTTKSLVIFLTYLVSNFGNFENLDKTMWAFDLQVEANTVIAVIVECFFARRLFMMSKNWILTGVVVILALVHLGTGLAFTVQSFRLGHFSQLGSLSYIIVVGIAAPAIDDVIIAVSMCYYLYKKRTGLSRTDSVVTTMMVYSINSGLASSIVATLCVILYLAMPTNLIWVACFWLLGKCYVNSFLGLLNTRDQLRDRARIGGVVTISGFSSGGETNAAAHGMSSARRALAGAKSNAGVGAEHGDVEIGVLEIGVSRSVIQHSDAADVKHKAGAGTAW
ncbi:uncharacterized protein BXZ73DRAFT_101214 [Epithele typhae]|uniref:uncharacterized protein n=1 Tax=Epithele typhae TaxID=378194 RepID=UPI0020080E8D|nr:uncharacterized protein BXZ73DRAFT_101214 [Epithele typhae]KAH9933254.1 hypothetical protein BXZ73DRAFT_101214 [Epithele typhae]